MQTLWLRGDSSLREGGGRNCLKEYLQEQNVLKGFFCNISIRNVYINDITPISAYVLVKPELPRQQVPEIREVIL